MKTSALVFAFFLLASITTINAQSINTDKSKVKFHITGGGLFKVKGTFTGMQGDFNLSTETLDTSSFDICIDASTINTKNKKRDKHLKNEDFFNIETYPNICFKSTSVNKTDTGYITKGELTLHGVTKTIEIPFEYKNNTFTGNLVVNRFDYDLGKDFGTFRVGKEAKITIICVVD